MRKFLLLSAFIIALFDVHAQQIQIEQDIHVIQQAENPNRFYGPVVASNRNGLTVSAAIVLDLDDTNVLSVVRMNENGNPLDESPIVVDEDVNGFSFDVIVNLDGSFIIVWEDISPLNERVIYMRSYDEDGSAIHDARAIITSRNYIFAPKIIIQNNIAVISWLEQVNLIDRVFQLKARLFDINNPFEPLNDASVILPDVYSITKYNLSFFEPNAFAVIWQGFEQNNDEFYKTVLRKFQIRNLEIVPQNEGVLLEDGIETLRGELKIESNTDQVLFLAWTSDGNTKIAAFHTSEDNLSNVRSYNGDLYLDISWFEDNFIVFSDGLSLYLLKYENNEINQIVRRVTRNTINFIVINSDRGGLAFLETTNRNVGLEGLGRVIGIQSFNVFTENRAVALSHSTINESERPHTLIGQLYIQGDNRPQNYLFQIISINNVLAQNGEDRPFEIEGTNFKARKTLNYEERAYYTVNIRATHRQNPEEIYEKTFLIKVIDQAEISLNERMVVNNTYSEKQSNACIRSDQNGNTIAAWQGKGKQGYGIYFRRYDIEGRAQSQELLASEIEGIYSVPKVAMDQEGNFIIAWYGDNLINNERQNGIFVRRFLANGNADGATQRIDEVGLQKKVGHADIAMDAQGNYIVVWIEYTQEEGRKIKLRKYNRIEDAFTDEEMLLAVENPLTVKIAMLSEAEYAITWTQFNSMDLRFELIGKYFRENGFSRNFTISTLNSFIPTFDLSLSDDASIHVVWEALNAQNKKDLFFQSFREVGLWGHTFDDQDIIAIDSQEDAIRINRPDKKDHTQVRISTSSNGTHVVCWKAKDTAGNMAIYSSYFDTTSGLFEGQIQLNTATPLEQNLPDICFLPNGKYAVVWEGKTYLFFENYGINMRYCSINNYQDGELADQAPFLSAGTILASNPLSVYPNPGKEKITIKNLKKDSLSEIYNCYGTLIWSGSTQNNELNISNLPSGWYYVKIKGNAATLRFIKM